MTGSTAGAITLGHQGGWDEAALFVIPVLVALGAVWLVERTQRKRRSETPEDDDGDSTGSQPD